MSARRVLGAALAGAVLTLGLGSVAVAMNIEAKGSQQQAPAPATPPKASESEPKGPPPRLKQIDHRVYRLTVLQVAAQTELTEEAVKLYFSEAVTDGCKADFVDSYNGMIMTSLEDDENIYVESKIMPGWSHEWFGDGIGCE